MTPEEYQDALDNLMARTLARLSLISDGKTSSPGISAAGPEGNEKGSATISHSKGTSASPILRLGPQDWGWEIRSLKNRYGRAHKIESKRALITEALKLLIRAKHAPWRPIHSDRHVHKGNEAWRKIIADDQRHPAVVAEVYDISRATVYNCRAEFTRRNGKRKVA